VRGAVGDPVTLDLSNLPHRFGPYVLVRALGGGGMGNVFLGVYGTPEAEKLCVVKRLIPETLADPERLARFRREADIVRRLSHTAIAKTLAVDEVAGEPYIVQEFLEGRTLTQVLATAHGAGRSFPVAVAIHVVREVAGALAYAHQLDGRGLVHRDVAPENIMLTFTGEVRLIDFGIARAPSDPTLTEPGIVVGRQTYTAPELLRGAVADNRADIYSLGVVLWELLAGRALMLGELGKAPAPSSVPTAVDVPLGLDHVVLRAVAPRLADRFQDVEDFRRALGAFVPEPFAGHSALRDFIRRCYDVETERAHTAEAVAEARPLLDAVPPNAPGPPDRSGRRAEISIAVFAIACVGAVAILAAHRTRPRESASSRELLAPTDTAPALAPTSPAPISPPPLVTRAPGRPIAVPSASAPVPHSPYVIPSRRPGTGPTAGAVLDRARDSFTVGDLGSAERDARSVLHSNATASQRARAELILGQASLVVGHRREAEAAFANALQLDPSNESAAAFLARLRRRATEGGQP